MDKVRDDFIYYGNRVKDPELDSCLLADYTAEGLMEAEYVHRVKKGNALAAVSFCMERNMDPIEMSKVVLMLILEKYTNNKALLSAVSSEGRFVPVFLSSEETPGFSEYFALYLKQMDESKFHSQVDFEELRAEFGWNSFPFITSETRVYESFSLADHQDKEAKLGICVTVSDRELTVSVKYNQVLYNRKTFERFFLSFDAVLGQIAAGEDRIAALSLLSEELLEELDAFNQTEFPYDDSVSVVDLIQAAAERHPDRVAVVYREKEITYREFQEMTDRIARYIHSRGIGREDVVSILIPRCEYMPVAAVGALKAGAAYQPLDPTYPPDRLKFMMEDAKVRLLIADASLLSLVPD